MIGEYFRVSDDDTDIGIDKTESCSISNQRSMIQAYLQSKEDLKDMPVKEFCDDGYSGVSFNRPAVKELLKEIQMGKIQCVIVKDLSRFGRNHIEVGDYLEQIFPFLGVRFIAVTDQYDSAGLIGDTGGIEFGFKNLIHEMYSKDLSKKIKSVKKIYQEKGYYSGGGIPFGYVINPEKRKGFLKDEKVVSIVKRIFSLALSGKETGEIARHLNEKKLPTPGVCHNQNGTGKYLIRNHKKNLWTSSQVAAILQNEVYKGTFVTHKLAADSLRTEKKLDPASYIKFEHAHEAYVTEDEFKRIGKIFGGNGSRKNMKYHMDENFTLRRKVKCGYCGYSMYRNSRIKRPHFSCRMRTGISGCNSMAEIHVDTLEDIVLCTIQKYLAVLQKNYEKNDSIMKKMLQDVCDLKSQMKQLKMKVDQLHIKKLDYYQQYKDGKIEREVFVRYKEQLEKKILNVEEGIRSNESEVTSYYQKLAFVQTPCSVQTHRKIDKLTPELVKELIDRIDVYSADRIEIYFKYRNELIGAQVE